VPVVRFGPTAFRLHFTKVTTGPPLYLVSACSSAEEFVAAFRRYADRTGLFIPAAAPLPAGRRGRIALTLKDGGVMIEGEAEILQSSAKPTVLHGRPGMTVKFVDADEPSKIVIGELERARLAMKPAPTTVAPRPAAVPAEPRPIPPVPNGRIDAANALAECVVIGDPTVLVATANAPRSAMPGVPSIPAAPRGKTPSAAPPIAEAKPSAAAPASNSGATSRPGAAGSKLTSVGFPAVDRLPASLGVAEPVARATGDSARVSAPARGDSERVAAPAPRADSSRVAAPAPRADSARVAAPAPRADSARVAAPAPRGDSARVAAPASRADSTRAVSNATTLGMPALDRKPDQTLPDNTLVTAPLGITGLANPTPPSVPAQDSPLDTKQDGPPRADATPPRFFHNATVPSAAPQLPRPTVHEEQTTIGQGPPVNAKRPAATPLLDPIADDEATAIGAVPKRPTDPMPAATPRPTPEATPIATAAEASGPQRSANPRAEAAKQKATSIGFPAMRHPFETQPLGIVPPAHPSKFAPQSDPAPPTLPKAARSAPPAAPRGKNPTAPPLTPRHPTPVAPVPIVRGPAKAAPSMSPEEEKTDVGSLPTVTASPLATADDGSGATPTAEQPVQRSGGMRASEILAAIPAGDWTMSPDELVPHALPAEEKVGIAAPPQEPTPAPAPPPKGPPTGDWTMSVDPQTGWTEPAKAEKPARAPSPASGNPVGAVASDKPISVVQWDEKPTGIGESKIEIDATLMEPLGAASAGDDEPAHIVDHVPASDVPPLFAPMPPRSPSELGMETPSQPSAVPYRQSSLDLLGFVPTPPEKRKKLIIAAIGAGALAVGAIVILVLTLGGQDKPVAKVAEPEPGPAKMVAKPEVDAAVEAPPVEPGSNQLAVEPGSAASEQPAPPPVVEKPKPPAPVATGPCKVDIKSTPPGADVYVAKQKLGTTPTSFELPCGSEAKLTLRKKSFPNTNKSFTPIAGKANKLTIKLAKTLFQVKVTSMPAGATITAGGKTMGVTPTTIKLPGFEPTALTLSKPGYAPDTARVNPKQNNASHHVTLKKGKGR
jgi:hypothetical protein